MAHACSHCGATPALFSCSACKSAFYCAELCQKAHWKAHKGLCREITAVWGPIERKTYGEWSDRLSVLIAERPQFIIAALTRDDLRFRDPDHPRAAWEPLRGVVSFSSHCLPPTTALAVLLLAAEARSSALSTPNAAARRALQEVAFSITLLAASPESSRVGPAEGTGLLLPLRSSGSAEAQYFMGLDYFTGAAPTCPDGRRVWRSALLWMVMSAEGGYAPAQAWLKSTGKKVLRR